MHRSLHPCESVSKTTSRSVQPCLLSSSECQIDDDLSPLAVVKGFVRLDRNRTHGYLDPHESSFKRHSSKTCFLRLNRVRPHKRHVDRFCRFCRAQADRRTDHVSKCLFQNIYYFVSNNSPHLMHCMRSGLIMYAWRISIPIQADPLRDSYEIFCDYWDSTWRFHTSNSVGFTPGEYRRINCRLVAQIYSLQWH